MITKHDFNFEARKREGYGEGLLARLSLHLESSRVIPLAGEYPGQAEHVKREMQRQALKKIYGEAPAMLRTVLHNLRLAQMDASIRKLVCEYLTMIIKKMEGQDDDETEAGAMLPMQGQDIQNNG